MEKRFVLFLVLAVVVIFGHLAVVQIVSPPKPEVAKKDKRPPAAAEDQGKEIIPAPQVTSDKDARDAEPQAEPQPGSAPELSAEVAADRPPREWASLGSYARDSRSPLLVTFSNRGAAIERIELTERMSSGKLRYRNLEERSGYLGDLALTVAEGGCRVNVVGDGTPASKAQANGSGDQTGIRVGDLLTQVDGRPVRQPSDLKQCLQNKRPGAKISLSIRRGEDAAAREIKYTLTLDDRPFELIRPEPVAPGGSMMNPPSLLMSLVQVGKKEIAQGEEELAGLPSLRTETWQMRRVEGAEPAIEFRFRLHPAELQTLGISGDLEIIKRYRLASGAGAQQPGAASPLHHLRVELELVNHGQEPLPVSYRLDGPNGLTLEGWWYLSKIHPHMFASAGARDVLFRTDGSLEQLIGCQEIVKYAQKNEKTPDKSLFAEGDDEKLRSLQYAAVDTQYFLAALLPEKNGSRQSAAFQRAATTVLSDLAAIEKARLRTANVSFYVTSPVASLQPGKSLQQNFLLYAGPKAPDQLAPYGLSESIYYGWFSWVAKPLSGLLHFFYGIVRNYGLAIIMLTVLVRGCMFPLSRKAAKNAAMMQELAPEMRKIAEKYKNEMDKRAKAQQELFRKHNYNPFSGCWLMFLQLPVFIGLYRSLAVDIELRQAPLIPGLEWASNLAGPDMLLHWESVLPAFLGAETGMLGPYLNVLPICTMILFLVHQQLFTPPATDEQTRMQMQMMKFMTVFIGFMFFKVASGLCLYFIASSLWSVAERVLLPKQKKTDADVVQEQVRAKDKGPGMWQKLLAKIEANGAKRQQADRRRGKRSR